jgi:hypothetical protein
VTSARSADGGFAITSNLSSLTAGWTCGRFRDFFFQPRDPFGSLFRRHRLVLTVSKTVILKVGVCDQRWILLHALYVVGEDSFARAACLKARFNGSHGQSASFISLTTSRSMVSGILNIRLHLTPREVAKVPCSLVRAEREER